MNEFEQQVATALSSVEDFVDGTGAVWVKRDEVAPRVAEAIIQASRYAAGTESMEALTLEERDRMLKGHKAALTALRGER